MWDVEEERYVQRVVTGIEVGYDSVDDEDDDDAHEPDEEGDGSLGSTGSYKGVQEDSGSEERRTPTCDESEACGARCICDDGAADGCPVWWNNFHAAAQAQEEYDSDEEESYEYDSDS